MSVFNVANTDGKKRILIIEDNIESQLILKVYLRELYSIDIAEDAEGGVAFLKKNSYDLLLLDINLPGKLEKIKMSEDSIVAS